MNAKRKDRRPRVRPGERTTPEGKGNPPDRDELEVREGARARRWQRPPRELADRVRRWPGERIAPSRSDRAKHLPWRPSDVRSGSDVREAGQPVVLSRMLEDGELTVTATPPTGDGPWSFNGRIWLDEAETLDVLLVHEDHVLHQLEVRSGAFFEFEEFVSPGWSIEIHRRDAPTLVLDDPTA